MKNLILSAFFATTLSVASAQTLSIPNLVAKAQSTGKLYSKAEFDELWTKTAVCIKDGSSFIGSNDLFAKKYNKKDCSAKKVEMFNRIGETIVLVKVTELPNEYIKTK